jgi:magnesium transporter
VRSAGIGEDFEGIYVVDEHGKYVGCVSLRHLLTRPENLNVESLSDGKAVFVHADTHRDEVKSLLKKHDLVSMPVLDHDNRLIGQVSWNGNGDGEWMR